jgi:AcrR family transcriptional regulator
MRELARRLGVSAMTPYRYFEDKDAILSEVRARAFEQFADWLEEQRGTEPDSLARAYAHFAVQHQAQYRLMFEMGQKRDVPAPTLLKQERRARAALTAQARDFADRTGLGSDPDLLGLTLWSVLHGVTTLYLTGKLSAREFDQVLSHCVSQLSGDGEASGGLSDDPFASEPRAQAVSASLAG